MTSLAPYYKGFEDYVRKLLLNQGFYPTSKMEIGYFLNDVIKEKLGMKYPELIKIIIRFINVV